MKWIQNLGTCLIGNIKKSGDLNFISRSGVYQGGNDSTAPYELMHAMGLYHTFDNDGKFTYKLYNTDNIMDYTHQVREDRFSTNKWQWKILNSNM
ncbi:hypothetical protein GCM10023230_10120 [Flavobacterium hankyongi]|uniref:Peptidase M12A domain-containing protein n=1 Tax=Flavobacterium hankyongi TaxID=1176532 RepID=A0ABP8ZPU0_9FLAO